MPRTTALNRAASGTRTLAGSVTTAGSRVVALVGADTTPPTVSGLVATPSNTSAQIDFSTSELARAYVEYGLTVAYGTTTALSSLAINHTHMLSGLVASTTYHYRVVATDASGNVTTGGDNTFATVPPVDTTAPVQSAITVAAVTTTTARITWITDEPASSQVEYGLTGAYGSSTVLDSALVTSHSVTVTGLSANTLYHFRVKAADAASNLATSGDNTLTTAAAADVTGPVISAEATSNIITSGFTRTWTTNEAATSQIEYGLTASYGSTTTIDNTLVTSHSVTVTGLQPGTLYHFRVKSQDASGNLTNGPDATVTTTASSVLIALSQPSSFGTYNSLGIEIPYSGDTNQNAVLAMRWQEVGATSWRTAQAPQRFVNGTDTVFLGSILNLTAGRSYNVEITATDPDGATDTKTVVGATQQDLLLAPAALYATATRFVDPVNGLDANAGTSEGAAWKTLEKAITTAGAGIVVGLLGGYHRRPWHMRTAAQGAITFVAKNAAVNDSRAEINSGTQAIIEPLVVAGPTGAADADLTVKGPWVPVTLTGPNTAINQGGTVPAGGSYAVYKWANCGIRGAQMTLCYSSTRTGAMTQVANWKAVAGTGTASPAAWAELMYTNRSYNYGCYGDFLASPANNDLYLRVHASVGDPNTYYWYVSSALSYSQAASDTDAVNGMYGVASFAQVRVSGVHLRGMRRGVYISTNNAANDGSVVDHCLFQGVTRCVEFNATKTGTPTTYYLPSHITLQYNRALERSSNLATVAAQVGSAGTEIPWSFAKASIIAGNGTTYPTGGLGASSESAFCEGNAGGPRGLVVRYNNIRGFYDGVDLGSARGLTSWTRYAGADTDIHDNLFLDLADDPWESDYPTENLRFWNNWVENCVTGGSYGPLVVGPNFVWNNVFRNLSNDSVPKLPSQTVNFNPESLVFKYSGNCGPYPPAIFWWNNTVWGNVLGSAGALAPNGGERIADAGVRQFCPKFFFYNNIFRQSGYAFLIDRDDSRSWNPFNPADHSKGQWTENYNFWACGQASLGMKWGSGNVLPAFTVSAYRTGLSQGANSQMGSVVLATATTSWDDVATVDAALTSPTTGNFTPTGGSIFLAAGTIMPNFERVGTDFSGAAPNVGATLTRPTP